MIQACNKLMAESLIEHEPIEPRERLIDWGSLDNANAFERSIYGISIQEGFNWQ